MREHAGAMTAKRSRVERIQRPKRLTLVEYTNISPIDFKRTESLPANRNRRSAEFNESVSRDAHDRVSSSRWVYTPRETHKQISMFVSLSRCPLTLCLPAISLCLLPSHDNCRFWRVEVSTLLYAIILLLYETRLSRFDPLEMIPIEPSFTNGEGDRNHEPKFAHCR